MLFILDEEGKPRTPEDINRIASAEIPDPITHPLAYETVTNSMTHGPCGLLNPEAPCMKNGRCTKNYPFNFAEVTTLMGEENENNNGKLTYRRRIMIDRVVLRNSGRTTIDNRRIALHNLYLAAKYNAHINVKIYNEVNSIKYVYKYVYKGHDRAQVHVGNPAATEPQDEMNNFLDARYVSALEACWSEEAMTAIYSNFCERYWAVRISGSGGIIGRMYTVSPRDIEKICIFGKDTIDNEDVDNVVLLQAVGHRVVVYLYQQHDGGFYSAFEVDTIEVPRSILELPGFIMKLGDIKGLINLYELFRATKKDKTSFPKCKIPSPNIYEMNKIINTRKPKKIKTSLEF